MKVALVHDYLREYGGAERVLEDLHEIFPEAPVYTAYLNPKGLGSHFDRMKNWDIRTSWIQKLPFASKLISPFRIFAAKAFESFDLSEFDVIISSDAIYFAKAVKTDSNQLHITYIHTPPRYLYGYTTSSNYKKHWWTRIGGEIINHFLRPVDFKLSQKPGILVANSEEIRSRIKKFYRRDAIIIHPAVNLSEFKNSKKKIGNYYLSLGRLVRSKGIEVAIKACNELSIPLKVAGTGPLLEEFKKMAGPTVEILGSVSDKERVELLSSARALILLEEQPDFGITAIESQAAGTPVIAVKAGGYKETIVDGKTGLFIDKATVGSLKEALLSFNPKKYKIEDCKHQAERFSKERFKKEIVQLIEKNHKK